MTLPPPSAPLAGISRNTLIAVSVVVFHVAALWALQSGLLRRAVELVVPAAILSEFIEPPAPKVVPPPPAPVKPQVVQKKNDPPPPPQLRAVVDPTPAPAAPTGVIDPPPPPPVFVPAEPVVVAAPAAAPPAPPKIELPSSDADYLQNPKPPYPPISKRLGEQGKVTIRVLISVNGTADKAEIRQSSGYDRLDQAALSTVLRWRYVPGKRNGVVETMWFNVPINFVLE